MSGGVFVVRGMFVGGGETFCETANFNSVGSPKITCLGN